MKSLWVVFFLLSVSAALIGVLLPHNAEAVSWIKDASPVIGLIGVLILGVLAVLMYGRVVTLEKKVVSLDAEADGQHEEILQDRRLIAEAESELIQLRTLAVSAVNQLGLVSDEAVWTLDDRGRSRISAANLDRPLTICELEAMSEKVWKRVTEVGQGQASS